MKRKLTALVIALMAASTVLAAKGSDRPSIADIKTNVVDGTLSASFRLVNSLDAETLERIHSGIPVTFKHRLELVGQRRFWLSSRRIVGRVRVETRVEYDPLLKRYTLWRQARGGKRVGAESASEERVTADETEMQRFLTVVEAVPLTEPGNPLPLGRLKLKVHSNLGRRYVMMIFPGSLTVSAESQFELDGTP